MSSPDITPYVDLRLFDRNAQTIFESARALVEARMPGVVLREASTEVVLLEGQSLIADEMTFAVNRIPGAMVEILLKLYGIYRDQGAAATGEVEFTVVSSAGHVIPGGTTMRVGVGSGQFVELYTINDLVIAPGQLTGTTLVEARTNSTLANGIAVATTLSMVSSLSSVQSVQISVATSGGRDIELPSDYLSRGIQSLRRLVNTLVAPVHFEAAALSDARVYRAKAIDLFDSTAGSGNPGDHAGHISIAVLGPDGLALSAGDKTELETEMMTQSQANLAVHVFNPTTTSVDVNVSIKTLSGYDFAAVSTAVQQALTTYLSPLTWKWSGVVRRNEIISLIDRVVGVDYVDTLTTPAANITLSGVANLTTAGTLTVTAAP